MERPSRACWLPSSEECPPKQPTATNMGTRIAGMRRSRISHVPSAA